MAFPQQFDLDSPTPQDYFPLSKEFAATIRTKFKLSPNDLEEGLYYSSLSGNRYRLDVMPKEPNEGEGVLEFDASYLVAASYNQFLYGRSIWTRKFLQKTKGTSDGKVELIPIDEFRVTVRSTKFLGEDGVLTNQIWIVRSNGERWLIFERDSRGDGRSTRVTGIPGYFLPVGDGLLDLTKSGILHRAFQSGRTLSRFEKIDLNEKGTAGIEFTVATRPKQAASGSIHQIPLLVYDPPSQKVVFAGWSSDSREYSALDRSELRDRRDVDLFLYDLEDNTVRQLAFGLKWRFHLSPSGLFIETVPGSKLLDFRKLDWSKAVLHSATPLKPKYSPRSRLEFVANEMNLVDSSQAVEKRFQIDSNGEFLEKKVSPEKDFTSLSQETLHQMMLLGYPADLLHQVGTLQKIPRSHHPVVNDALAKALGEFGKGWALLLYEEGEYPEDNLGSFLWEMNSHILPASPTLSNLTNVFWFDPSFYKVKSFATLSAGRVTWDSALPKIRDALDGKQALAFFQDFPSPHVGSVSPSAIHSHADHLRDFNQTYGECLDRKRCRMVTSLRRELYDPLQKQHPDLFTRADIIEIPELPERLRLPVARRIALPLSRNKYRIPITEAAIRKAVFAADSIRKEMGGNAVSLPGAYENFFDGLFIYATSSFQSNPTVETREITETLVEKYRAYLQGDSSRWQLRTKLHEVAGFSEKVPFLMWVRSGKPSVPALTESLYKVWAENRDSVLTDSRVGHALIRIPSRGVDLLVPEAKPVRVLDEVPDLLALHSKGFFCLVEKGYELVLSSFVLDRSNSKNDSELPGKMTVLKDKIQKSEWMEKRSFKIAIAGDTARVLSGRTLQVYGMHGKLSEKPLSDKEFEVETKGDSHE